MIKKNIRSNSDYETAVYNLISRIIDDKQKIKVKNFIVQIDSKFNGEQNDLDTFEVID
jgi:hypothetical protein